MAFQLSRIDRLNRSIPGHVDVALLPPRSAPTAATVWLAGDFAGGATTFLFAGPDADSAGAIVVTASADLWKRAVNAPEVDAEKVERVTVLGGGSLPALPEIGPGAVFVIHGDDAARSRPATSLPVIWFGTVQPTALADGDVYVATTALS